MTYQSQSNAWVAYKVQSGLGSQASGSGGTILRSAGGPGGRLAKAATESNEVRRDGMRTRGRHGTQKTSGQWLGEVSIGSHETILQAIMRDTWDASALSLTQSDFTSLAVASNVVTFGSGDPRTLGLRLYDVIRFTNMSAAANNSKNCRIIAMTSTTITVAETLTDMGADTTCTITRPKKLIQYSASSLVKRYFTIDEYDVDIDLSEVMTDFVFGSAKFSMQTNGLLTCEVGGIGTGQLAAQTTGTSPLLTSPSESTAVPLSVADATIRVNGTDVVDLTGLDLTLDITPSSPEVIASKYGPDVFSGQMAVSMNLTALRKDLQYLSDFVAETVYSLHILAVENESEPKDFLSIVVPNFTIGSADKSALSKSGGARTQTISVPAALVGKDNTGTGYDATMVKFQSTGA